MEISIVIWAVMVLCMVLAGVLRKKGIKKPANLALAGVCLGGAFHFVKFAIDASNKVGYAGAMICLLTGGVFLMAGLTFDD